MARLIRTLAARADLRNIWLYIAQHNLSAANRVLDRMDQTLRLLINNPRMGELHRSGPREVRRITIGSYVAYYEVTYDYVKVLRIFHSAQRHEDLL